MTALSTVPALLAVRQLLWANAFAAANRTRRRRGEPHDSEFVEEVEKRIQHFLMRSHTGVCTNTGWMLVVSFNQSADYLARTKARSTKSHETARKSAFRDASCDFVDRVPTIETREPQNDPLPSTQLRQNTTSPSGKL